ncbi:hypothetical protein VA249_19180 [Vibrio alfacsensis]|uniref:hypothetical protein n=1 Tax=Vibrio alfacsensis TaxID=1074311 RepID=UPI001BEEBD71|nr:hypothetical protein [Vibrio alfacsensis]BBM65272.1 hypothetical protein VA249_19180 [Vibrio alfacsensis]
MANVDTQIVAKKVLNQLLSGMPVSRATITELLKYGPNSHLQMVMRHLRTTYKVIIHYSQKDGGYWFMTPENIVEFVLTPEKHAARKDANDVAHSKKLLENRIALMAHEYKHDLLQHMFPDFQSQLLRKQQN